MRNVFALVFLLLAFAAPVVAQTNPCTAPLGTGTAILVARSGVQVNLAATLPDIGTTWQDASTSTVYPVATGYELGYFPSTPAPTTTATPLSPTTLPTSAFTLAPGTTDCYTFSATIPALAPTTSYAFGLRGTRPIQGTSPAVTGVWGFNVDGPFVSAPPAIQPVGTLRRK